MTALAPTLQAFFTERLIRQRQASPHTLAAYRDTLRLLLVFASARKDVEPSKLDIDDLDAPLIGAFLDHQQPQRVPVGRKCMGTSLALTYQAFREERLQGWGKCGHAAPPSCRSKRLPTNVSNSGAAERYQYVLTGSTWPR